jgi:transcription antitermination factor NusB
MKKKKKMGQAISRSEAREIAVRIVFADGFNDSAVPCPLPLGMLHEDAQDPACGGQGKWSSLQNPQTRAQFSAAGRRLDDGVMELALDGKTAAAKELEFINKILTTVKNRLNEIDKLIQPHLKGWTLERLGKTDLAVLRTAAAEMLIGETARPVIINECVAISKKYGTESTGGFINGILSQIAAEQNPQNTKAGPTDTVK